MEHTPGDTTDLEGTARLTGERRQFLAAVARVCDRVLPALGGAPLDAFQKLIQRDLHRIATVDDAGAEHVSLKALQNHIRPEDLENPSDPLLTEFACAIGHWARLFRLTDDWLIDAALQSLAAWTFFQGWGTGMLRSGFAYELFPQRGPVGFAPFVIRIHVDDYWQLWAGEDRAVAKHRIEAAFKSRLRAELDRIEAEAKRAGYMYASPKMPAKAARHYEWLARRVVERDTYDQIARDAGTDPPTVFDAVKRTASIIGLGDASLA